MTQSLLIYNGLLVFCFSLAYVSDKTSRKSFARVSLVLMVLALSVVSGFRATHVGIDTANYTQNFLNLGVGSGWEVGFRTVVRVLMTVLQSPHLVFFVFAFLTHALFIARLRSLRHIAPLRYSFLIYFVTVFFPSMSGVRQWLAVAVIFYATKYIFGKEKYEKFFLAVLIATMLHASAIVSLLFLLPVLFQKKRSAKANLYKLLFIVLAIPACIYAYQTLIGSYGYYFDDYSKEAKIGLMVIVKFLLLFFAMFTHAFSDFKQDQTISQQNKELSGKILFLFEFLALSMTFTGYFYNYINRIAWYFSAFTPVFYGHLLASKHKSASFIYKLLIAVIIGYIYLDVYRVSNSQWNEYQFFWQVGN